MTDQVTRRTFMKMAGVLVASLGWTSESEAAGQKAPIPPVELVAEALQEMAEGRVPLIWLHGLTCDGCSISFLNAAYPSPARVLTQYIAAEFHPTLAAATGEMALDAMNERLAAGNHILVVEGAVPAGMPDACHIGDETFPELLQRAASNAETVLALGTCAAFGGIPAAPPDPTGAISVTAFLQDVGINVPVITIPGCPVHPDWLIGTLVHLIKLGMPPLNEHGSPEMYFGEIIHNRCPEFYNYTIGKFAKYLGDSGCLFELGCMGIRTYADCGVRHWNNKVSWCIGAEAPCIGCAWPHFAQNKDFPLYPLYLVEENQDSQE